LHDALTQAFDRLLEQMPGAVATFEPGRILSRVHISRTGACLIEPGVVDGLLKAIGGQQVVTVDYYTASRDAWTKGRSITPWAVAVRGDTWLCVGYCHLRREPRDFNLARMSRLRLGPRSKPEAEPPENFDLDIYFSDRFEAMDGATREVRLRVGPRHAQYFRDKAYHRTQQVESSSEDEAMVVSYEVAGLDEFQSFVQSWGPKVTVLDPPELADRIVREARAVIDIYRD
jgi:predicted DNA-binding transcriptional regulator YafY